MIKNGVMEGEMSRKNREEKRQEGCPRKAQGVRLFDALGCQRSRLVVHFKVFLILHRPGEIFLFPC
jgi:hypothetical protein